MKGVELPINVLVIVAIAVVVLLGLIVLYFVGFNPFSGGVSLTGLKNAGCAAFTIQYDCGNRISDAALSDKGCGTDKTCFIDLPANSYLTGTEANSNTLLKLCQQELGAPTDADCKRVCGCP